MKPSTAKRLAELHRMLAAEYDKLANEDDAPKVAASTKATRERAREKARQRWKAAHHMAER